MHKLQAFILAPPCHGEEVQVRHLLPAFRAELIEAEVEGMASKMVVGVVVVVVLVVGSPRFEEVRGVGGRRPKRAIPKCKLGVHQLEFDPVARECGPRADPVGILEPLACDGVEQDARLSFLDEIVVAG